METLITNGIRVSVETFYHPHYSKPVEAQYVFAYRITILNESKVTVQLLRRHWFITEGTGLVREVEGEGVVGEQPTLGPGQQHQYVSWCHLSNSIGAMHGAYLMQRSGSGETFQVEIPRFVMQAAPALN